MQRIESSVTSISWIPMEAISGLSTKLPFEIRVAHYDKPPPDRLDDLEKLRRDDRFRFANTLRAWIDVDDDGNIVDYGQDGSGLIGSTSLRIGGKTMNFAAVPLPDIQPEPTVGARWVRFQQTAGGRTGVPAPRRVRKKPFIQIAAPLAWTTLALTINVDGSSYHKLGGASPFPRHWVYDHEGELSLKSGLIDFESWYREAFGKHSPWGEADSKALVTHVESSVERELSATILSPGSKPKKRKIAEGKTLVNEGEPGQNIFLLMDGVLAVEVSGSRVAEVGPGAILGERAFLEGGKRTATLRALTACRVMEVPGDAVDRRALEELDRKR